MNFRIYLTAKPHTNTVRGTFSTSGSSDRSELYLLARGCGPYTEFCFDIDSRLCYNEPRWSNGKSENCRNNITCDQHKFKGNVTSGVFLSLSAAFLALLLLLLSVFFCLASFLATIRCDSSYGVRCSYVFIWYVFLLLPLVSRFSKLVHCASWSVVFIKIFFARCSQSPRTIFFCGNFLILLWVDDVIYIVQQSCTFTLV